MERPDAVSSRGCKVLAPNPGILLASGPSYCRVKPIECSVPQSVSVSVPQERIRGSAISSPDGSLIQTGARSRNLMKPLLVASKFLLGTPLMATIAPPIWHDPGALMESSCPFFCSKDLPQRSTTARSCLGPTAACRLRWCQIALGSECCRKGLAGWPPLPYEWSHGGHIEEPPARGMQSSDSLFNHCIHLVSSAASIRILVLRQRKVRSKKLTAENSKNVQLL